MLQSSIELNSLGRNTFLCSPPTSPSLAWTNGLIAYVTHFIGLKCIDDRKECPEWASDGECTNNPGFMLNNCKKSCKTCKYHKTVKILHLTKSINYGYHYFASKFQVDHAMMGKMLTRRTISGGEGTMKSAAALLGRIP